MTLSSQCSLLLAFWQFPTTEQAEEQAEGENLSESWAQVYKRSTLTVNGAVTVAPSLNCIWQIFFLFALKIKSPQCTGNGMYSKEKFLIANFLPRVLIYQKREISLPVGYKTKRPKTGDWEWLWRHFRTSRFAKNRFLLSFSYCELINLLRNGTNVVYKKIRKCWRNLFIVKLVVLKWYQIRSHSPVLGLVVLYPMEVKFHVFGTSKHREGKLLSLFFILAILISTLGRFSWANEKKNLSCTQLYIILENSPKIIDYTPWLVKNCVSIYNSMETKN